LTYFGHVNHIDSESSQHYYCMATHGHRSRGKPNKKWLDNIREDCEDMNMSILQASRLSWDRTKWRNTVHNLGCCSARTKSLLPRPISQS